MVLVVGDHEPSRAGRVLLAVDDDGDVPTRGHTCARFGAAATDTLRWSRRPIELPVFYSRFATMLVVILVVVILAAIFALVGGLRKFPAFSLPGLMFPNDPPEKLAAQKERDGYLGGVQRVFVPGAARTADWTEPCDKWRTEAVSVDDYPTVRASGQAGGCARWRTRGG